MDNSSTQEHSHQLLKVNSTYRIQFHAGFTFKDALQLVPYLSELGISHLYSSPCLKAVSGSTHGYNVVDYSHFNPEIGSIDDFTVLVAALRERGMGLIMDLVPNHMGVESDENIWWNDVLEHGVRSPLAEYFDIDWSLQSRAGLKKLILPVLGNPIGEVLAENQINLIWREESFFISYGSRNFPVSIESYAVILGDKTKLPLHLIPFREDLQRFIDAASKASLSNQPFISSEKKESLFRKAQKLKKGFAKLMGDSSVNDFVEARIAEILVRDENGRYESLIEQILDRQHYRLAFWRIVDSENNYRRFFAVSELAAVRVEEQNVFDAVHHFPVRLAHEGLIDGFRIDHPDGLLHPQKYLSDLQRALKTDAGDALSHLPYYVVVEKILADDESLIKSWSAAGTTGYEFIIHLNGLFVDSSNEGEITRIYQEFTGKKETFEEVAYRTKKLVLENLFYSEREALTKLFYELSSTDPTTRDLTIKKLREALSETIAEFPVYRSYVNQDGVSETDRESIKSAVSKARKRAPDLEGFIFDFIENVLTLQPSLYYSENEKALQLKATLKFQQLTSPVMAKGVEDTAFYRYNRFLSLNEVGGNPGRFGFSTGEVHKYFKERVETQPGALSPLSTHDTKRSEDVRARLNGISERPDLWQKYLQQWAAMNGGHRIEENIPDANDEYLLYQSLIGFWPSDPQFETEELHRRTHDYMEKCLREAKVYSHWGVPDLEYEKKVQGFIRHLLNDPSFLASLREAVGKFHATGSLNSISQKIVQLTAPGVPDIYQGTEMMDLSLVDPDNRRKVEFEKRLASIGSYILPLEGPINFDHGLKQFITKKILTVRGSCLDLFVKGDYRPLSFSGEHSESLFGFSRTQKSSGKSIIVIIPRLAGKLIQDKSPLDLPGIFSGVKIIGSENLIHKRWKNVFTEEVITSDCDGFDVGSMFRPVPFLVMVSQDGQ